MKNLICIVTTDCYDGMPCITPKIIPDTQNDINRVKADFINDYIIHNDNDSIKQAVDRIINDDDHNLITTDGDKLAEIVESELDIEQVDFEGDNKMVYEATEVCSIIVNDGDSLIKLEIYRPN